VRMRRLLGLRRVDDGLRGRLRDVLWSEGTKDSRGSSLRGCREGIGEWQLETKERGFNGRVVTRVTRFRVTLLPLAGNTLF